MDLLILAVITGFLLYRLNAVLGQKDKDDPAEKNALKSFFPPDKAEKAEDTEAGKVITLPGRAVPPVRNGAPQDGVCNGPHNGPMSLDNQIAMLSQADASFDEMRFLAGAKAAFGMIVDAFARGDRDALRPLLSDTLYHDFIAEIDERMAKGHTLETIILSIEDVAITHARVMDNMMRVTVRIVSVQTNIMRDETGAVVSGGEQSDDVTDFWIFQRQIGHRDPNWALVSTDAA